MEEAARESLFHAVGKAYKKPRGGEAELGATLIVQHRWIADHAQPIQCGVYTPGMHGSLDQLSISPYTVGTALCAGDLSSFGRVESCQVFWVEPVTCFNNENALEGNAESEEINLQVPVPQVSPSLVKARPECNI